jgi:diguanylate cyclase (GGDEF)-like protein
MWRPLQPQEWQGFLGLIIQSVGIALLALLCLFLRRSTKRLYLDYWAFGWVSYALALGALFVSMRLTVAQAWVESLYYAGEYAFGILLVLGLRNFAGGPGLARRDWRVVPAAIGLALILPRVSSSFSMRFVPQSLILVGVFAAAWVQLEKARKALGTTPGLSITAVSLAVLILYFLHYAPVLIHAEVRRVGLPLAYSAYTSIYDLLLEVLLGFGMVTLAMEDARREAEQAAHTDALTQSLNRHAFYSMVESRRVPEAPPAPGCVALVDVDDLKTINDSLGHAAGDDVIRGVAKAIRSLVRPDDLVFRWGGDEFLVVLFGVCEEETRRRLDGLAALVAPVSLPGSDGPSGVGVSFGVAGFEGGSLEAAVAAADAAMYRHKLAAKAPSPEAP